MRIFAGLVLIGAMIATISFAFGQPPARPEGGPRQGRANAESFVERMMSLDENHDGKLSKEEVKDTRLSALFERADTDHDGIVTKEELTAVAIKESASGGRDQRPGGDGDAGPGSGGPGGRGGPGGGRSGRRGSGSPEGPPPIGQILPPHVREMLRLTNVQKKKLDDLQKLVDNKLEQILTDEQKQQIEDMKRNGPGGPDGEHNEFGPPGGRGPGGPGGPNDRGGRGRGGPPGGGERPQRPQE